MELIILLVIIYFVWRHFKKKKASKVSGRQSAGAVVELCQPPKVKALRGAPVTSADVPKKWSERLEASNYSNNPDLAFVCSQSIYNCGLREISAGKLRLREDTSSIGYGFVEHGVILAGRFRDGFGCDCDPKAGIDVLRHVIDFFKKRMRDLDPSSQASNDLTHCIAEGHLIMADCFAMIGNQSMADKYYRMSYAMANCYGNPLYVRSTVIEHALGNYDVIRPRPVSLAVAFELALAMAGDQEPMGGHYIMTCVELRKLDTAALGQTWEQDYALYRQAEGAYPLYRVGLAKVYGLGTAQDVKKGLALLEQAYQQGSIQAAHSLYAYYNDLENELRYSSGRADKQLMRQLDQLTTNWSHRFERLKKDPYILQKVMDTGIANEEAANLSGQYAPSRHPVPKAEAVTASQSARRPNTNSRKTENTAEKEFDISRIPGIVYDDSNRQWKRRGVFGDHAVYYNSDGDEVTIYSAQVSGSSAYTSMGTLHWY